MHVDCITLEGNGYVSEACMHVGPSLELPCSHVSTHCIRSVMHHQIFMSVARGSGEQEGCPDRWLL